MSEPVPFVFLFEFTLPLDVPAAGLGPEQDLGTLVVVQLGSGVEGGRGMRQQLRGTNLGGRM